MAFRPKDEKAVKTAAQTMRPIRRLIPKRPIQELGSPAGVDLVSGSERKSFGGGTAMVIAPCWRMGPVTEDERNGLINHFCGCMASTRMTWTGESAIRDVRKRPYRQAPSSK
ncbi:helicase HerA-like domain-containing protein [Shigella flexneri]